MHTIFLDWGFFSNISIDCSLLSILAPSSTPFANEAFEFICYINNDAIYICIDLIEIFKHTF